MLNRVRHSLAFLASYLLVALVFPPLMKGDQTIGGITGTVKDKTGGVLPATIVTILGDQTKLTRTLGSAPTPHLGLGPTPVRDVQVATILRSQAAGARDSVPDEGNRGGLVKLAEEWFSSSDNAFRAVASRTICR